MFCERKFRSIRDSLVPEDSPGKERRVSQDTLSGAGSARGVVAGFALRRNPLLMV